MLRKSSTYSATESELLYMIFIFMSDGLYAPPRELNLSPKKTIRAIGLSMIIHLFTTFEPLLVKCKKEMLKILSDSSILKLSVMSGVSKGVKIIKMAFSWNNEDQWISE